MVLLRSPGINLIASRRVAPVTIASTVERGGNRPPCTTWSQSFLRSGSMTMAAARRYFYATCFPAPGPGEVM